MTYVAMLPFIVLYAIGAAGLCFGCQYSRTGGLRFVRIGRIGGSFYVAKRGA